VETVRIRAGGSVYPVLIGEGLLDGVGERVRHDLKATAAVVVTDRTVGPLHGPALRRSLRRGGLRVAAWIEVSPGERAKSWMRARDLLDALAAAKADRSTPVLALGGGVVGDLAGFAASLYMRGLPVVQVPTTVLAQVDSAVGGKTGINFAGAKNLVGTFHQPRLVVCDPAVLATLPDRDYRAGLAEAVKIGVTLRPDLMALLEDEGAALRDRNPGLLARVAAACLKAKGDLVGRDEKDADVRAILNYGHTIGHALEASAWGRWRHGEAVAVGMNAAAWIGESLGVTPAEVRTRQNALLLGLGLKVTEPGADKRAIARNIKLDKKVRGKNHRVVLTLQIGGASVWPHISGKLLRDAVRFIAS
jgi:3-dehydroquinate synthase